jgi:hypothetical protein
MLIESGLIAQDIAIHTKRPRRVCKYWHFMAD